MQDNAPMEPKEMTFFSNARELCAALLTYVLGFLYIDGILHYRSYTTLVLFCVLFTAMGLIYFRNRLGRKEHWIWLGCMWLCLLAELLGRNQAWDSYYILFVHAFAVYWLLTLSGKMLENQSSVFFPLDAINGLFVFPLQHLFSFFRTQVLIWGVRNLRNKPKVNLTAIFYGALAAVVSLCLLFGAGSLLSQADENFGAFLRDLLPTLEPFRFGRLIFDLLLSIPVGAYLCGLICGTDRVPEKTLNNSKNSVLSLLGQIRHVPNGVWAILLCAFAVLYLVFLGFQSSYFFGAFRRALPESFTVAEYARQGFFELCKILALNFALFWLVSASSVSSVREHLPAKLLSSILLAESVLFAVTALSKLILYIDCFGFTPLRLQSFWLICVLMAGCVLSLVSLWSRKKTFQLWLYITGISLALLHLY